MEERNFEQRCTIKFCVKLGKTGIESSNKLKQVYGEHALSRSQVFKWYTTFSEGRESIKDEPRSGKLSTSKTDNNVEIVRALVQFDRRLTVRMIASELNLNHATAHQILTEELAMKKLCVKFVPKNLTIEQKDNRKDLCLHLLERIERGRNFLKNVITGGETWIFGYDPEKKDKVRNVTSASPLRKKARRSKSKIKSMLICFFDRVGIVHTEFVPQGHTVNQFYYRKILERLRKRVVRLRTSIADNWMLHYDNAPCHTAISVIEFLAKKGIPVVPQHPYSPDLSPCDFFFPQN